MNSVKDEVKINQYLQSVKRRVHKALLSTLLMNEDHLAINFITIYLRCCLTSKYLVTPVRNSQCKFTKCVFNLSEDFAKLIIENNNFVCPSCQQNISKDNFFICKETEDILFRYTSEATEDLKDYIYLDTQEYLKNGPQNIENFIIDDLTKPKAKPTLTLTKSPVISSNDSFSLVMTHNYYKSESVNFSLTNSLDQESFSNFKNPHLYKSVSIDLVAASPRTNKWKERMKQTSPSPGRLNKWELRKRSNSPSGSPSQRINKWEVEG